jgi:hypothetical protein
VKIYATARDVDAATDLKQLVHDYAGRVEVVQLDMLSAPSIDVSQLLSCNRYRLMVKL